MYVVYSEKCLEYWDLGHPESPHRIRLAFELLSDKGFEFTPAMPCSEEDLELVHSRRHITRIKSGELFDSDTPNLPGIFDYARLSVGAALECMKLALGGEVSFSLMRPPGHHCGIDGTALGAPSLGFCYFNNIAIACMRALENVARVAVLDIDCHHGNGTQEILFRDPRAVYVSIHRQGFVYPGTGAISEDNCVNYSLRQEVDDAKYLETLSSALKEIERFDPDLIGVSAGFDTHRHDPVCGLGLSEQVYTGIGRAISGLRRKTFAVLEGGYGNMFPQCVCNFLAGLEQT